MTEIETIYNIIHNATYNDAVLLDIELSKVTDTKLITGMLVDLYSKEGYEADKKIILPILAQYKDYNLTECNEYYIKHVKAYRETMPKSPNINTLNKFISILSLIKEDKLNLKDDKQDKLNLKDNKDYVDFVKNLKNDDIEFFKNMLLKKELYEEVIDFVIRNN